MQWRWRIKEPFNVTLSGNALTIRISCRNVWANSSYSRRQAAHNIASQYSISPTQLAEAGWPVNTRLPPAGTKADGFLESDRSVFIQPCHLLVSISHLLPFIPFFPLTSRPLNLHFLLLCNSFVFSLGHHSSSNMLPLIPILISLLVPLVHAFGQGVATLWSDDSCGVAT